VFSPDQAKDVLVVAWAGMEILLKKVNKSAIEELIIQTVERLLAVDKAMDQGFPDSAKPQSTAFVM
jgi:hypothetical protein